jgi:hypothetical protein
MSRTADLGISYTHIRVAVRSGQPQYGAHLRLKETQIAFPKLTTQFSRLIFTQLVICFTATNAAVALLGVGTSIRLKYGEEAVGGMEIGPQNSTSTPWQPT